MLGDGGMMRIIGLILAVALMPVGCSNSPAPDGVAEILLEPAPGSYLCDATDGISGVLLQDVTVGCTVYDQYRPFLDVGTPYYVISGHVQNHDKDRLEITVWARGYDEAGEHVASIEEGFRIPGMIGFYLEYEESAEFVMHMYASDEVETIRLFAHSYTDPLYGPPSISSTPLPQTEMTRITFSRLWLIANEAERDLRTVEITFPASWLDEPPDIAEGEETVELALPMQHLMDHNTSDNPDELTVTFPDYYFDGL
jgi:hypothetical protein